MSLFHPDRLLSEGHVPGRACGPCTACCTVMAVTELHKPRHRACDHVCLSGCRIHAERPASCHEFHCLWLRGALDADEALRPDRLGVMFDFFTLASSGASHLIASELWVGAFDAPQVQSLLREVGETRTLHLAYRDGRWSTLEAGASRDTGAAGESASC